METLFPKEIIENTSESNFSKHSTQSKIIYSTIVGSVLSAILLLPFIYVDVGVRSQGLIRPVSEVNQVLSIVSGRIDTLTIRENDFVRQGQMIAQIASPLISEKLDFNTRRKSQVELLLSDLRLLLKLDSTNVMLYPKLQTPRYQSSYYELRQKIFNALQTIDQSRGELERNRLLFERDFVSQNVYENYLHSLNSSINDYNLLLEQQKNQWQMEKVAYQDEYDALAAENNELKQEQRFYVIRSPVSGTIQNMAGVAAGSYIYPNQTLAEVSPDTALIAEIYVSPNDIGLIRDQMQVRLQVSAFNHNQWGIIEGQVLDISHDVSISDNLPVFRVRCSLNEAYLELSNGYKGYLKKGMTVQARFIVTRRNLFQLLYDKMDDWLNPVWNDNKNATITAL